MHDASDMELLRDYDRQGSEAAFAALVQRHINLVYSVALRHVGIAAHAEEITQAVFIILTRKSAGLRADTILEGWLHETTRLTALSFLRGERRRQFREQEAYMQSILQENNDAATWNQLAPLLDEAVSRLGKKDRDAVVLRFFKDKNLREVAAALNVNEAAAQRRVHRAVEKLRGFFTKRGVAFSSAPITGAISANSVQAAPVGLAKTISAVAIAKGAAVSASTLTLIQGALKVMAWTKIKTMGGIGVVAGVATTLIAVTATTVFNHIGEDQYLEKAPPVVILRPSTTESSGVSHMHGPPFSKAPERFVALGQPIEQVLAVAYGVSSDRLVLPADLPAGNFDFLVAVPDNPRQALQAEIKKQFGLVARSEMRPENVLVLKVKKTNASGLQANHSGSVDGGFQVAPGKLILNNFTMSGMQRPLKISASEMPIMKTNIDNSFVAALGGYYLGKTVLDATGLTNAYNITLEWDSKLNGKNQFNAINEALQLQLGLELVPTNMPIEMLVVEKTQ